MSDRVKELKIKQSNGEYGEAIPLAVDAANVDLLSGKDLETELNRISESIESIKPKMWEITVPAAGWVSFSPAGDVSWPENTCTYQNSVDCEGMTDKMMLDIQYSSGDITSAQQWVCYKSEKDKITFLSNVKPAKDFNLLLLEVGSASGGAGGSSFDKEGFKEEIMSDVKTLIDNKVSDMEWRVNDARDRVENIENTLREYSSYDFYLMNENINSLMGIIEGLNNSVYQVSNDLQQLRDNDLNSIWSSMEQLSMRVDMLEQQSNGGW